MAALEVQQQQQLEGIDPSIHNPHRAITFGAQGLRITIKDLSYHVPSNENKKERAYLLRSVSGWFEPHQMSALMGPSGSGKTTLLDVLAGRKTAGVIEGAIQFGGQKPSQQFLRRYTGYVEQFDTLIGILTVEEMLMYTAELKRPTKESLASKKDAVEEVIHKLALETCRDVTIGDPLVKGISGGQAKRTNIGIALVTNPRVLFLDEPTSGLDSYTSNEVMTTVKALVNDGTTICATIHSPSQYCFNLFDRLLMLVKGRVVYFGPVVGATAFALTICPNVRDMRGYGSMKAGGRGGVNDAEFLVDLFTEADRQGKGAMIADSYDESQLKKDNAAQLQVYLEENSKETLSAELQQELATQSSTVTPWWWGLWTLIRYRTPKNFSSPEFLGPRIGDKITIGLLVLTLYLGIGDDLAPDNIYNIAAVLFMMCALPAFGAAAYVPSLVLERNLYVRERQDGLYLPITYILAKLFDELFIAACASLGMTAFVFYGVQLQGQWVLFWLTYYTTLCNGIVLAYFVAAISPNLDVANAVLPTYVVTLLFFAGFLFVWDDIPPWWKWYSYIDFLRYALGSLMANQFDNVDPPFIGNTTVLQSFGMDGVDKWEYLGYLSLFFIVFFLLAWATMTFKVYNTR